MNLKKSLTSIKIYSFFCNIIALYQLMLKRPKLKHQAPVHCDLEQSLKSLPFNLVKDKDNILNSILC